MVILRSTIPTYWSQTRRKW